MFRNFALSLLCALTGSGAAHGQILTSSATPSASPRLGPATTAEYRVGATIRTKGPTQNVRMMVALPLECAEQQVRVLQEEISPGVQVTERTLKTGEARQLLIYIPRMPGGQEATAVITFEVTTSTLLAPQETDSLRIPARPDRELKQYLGRSPYIETGHRSIDDALEEAWAIWGEDEPKVPVDEPSSSLKTVPDSDDDTPASVGEPTDWQRVEAIYDYVLDHVDYLEGEDQSAVQTLRSGQGDCQAIGALFVAMCRTAEIPARLVWVHDHQYAEFWLEDADGRGEWHPIETAGRRAFGEMPVARIILQKGDSFRVPERRRELLRYASDYALFLATASTKPAIRYVRELR